MEDNREVRKPHVLSCSYGKDSLACIGAIQELGLPLDRIIHCEVMATDTIPADLPPMVEFKAKADEIIFQMTGIKVEHIRSSLTYEAHFLKHKKNGCIYGWPGTLSRWCTSDLKRDILEKAQKGCHVYIGYAVDEPKRIVRLKSGMSAPLAEIGWTESDAMEWCRRHDLVSPVYTGVTSRGGCWFCHLKPVEELRVMRKQYPDYWRKMLEWDESARKYAGDRSFKRPHYLCDYERRFAAEDAGMIDPKKPFRWSMIDKED